MYLILTVAYYRRSTTMQEHSIEMQKYKAFEKATSEHLIIQKDFTDDAISARTTNISDRAKLQEIINLVKENKIKNLLVYKRDRLARNVVQHIKLYRIFREHQVKVIFTADDELPMKYSAQGELYEMFIGSMVQLEGMQIHERIRAKNIAKFKSGEHPGKLPYGYTSTKEEPIIRNEDQLDFIRTLYMKLYDGESIEVVSKYAKKVNADYSWSPSYIRTTLQRPDYYGIRVLKYKEHEPIFQEYKTLRIVDKHIWETVYDILESKRNKRQKREPLNLIYLLDGLVVCSNCESKHMLGIYNRPVYRCKKCKRIVNKIEIEKLVLEDTITFINSLLSSSYTDLIERYRKNSIKEKEQQIKNIERELNTLKQKIINIADELIRLNKDESEVLIQQYSIYKEQSKKIEDIKEEIYALRKLPSKLEGIKNNLIKKFDISTLNLENPSILQDVIKAIKIDGANVDLIYKYPFTGLKGGVLHEC